MRGKTIRQFLIDGQADGRWASELSNWTGKAYKIPRTYINQCTDREDLSNTGVYFLFGRNDETDEEQVYIGEAENIFNRLKQHLKVSQLYIAQVKRKHGLIERINYNLVEKESKAPQVPPEKEQTIEDALIYFKMI